MKKNRITLIGAAALVFAMGTTAYASSNSVSAKQVSPLTQPRQSSGYGCHASGSYGPMMDEDGNFLSREEFEAKLDEAIESGAITAEDKALYLNMYERCTSGSGMMWGGNSIMRG